MKTILLFREYLDVIDGRYDRGEWVVKIDALEIFSPYITPVHKHVYDNVLLGDVLEHDISGYDLLMMGDVVEHLPKEKAVNIIKMASQKSDVIITTPNGFYRQGAYKDNVHETHKCFFSKEELELLGAEVKIIGIILLGVIKCKE